MSHRVRNSILAVDQSAQSATQVMLAAISRRGDGNALEYHEKAKDCESVDGKDHPETSSMLNHMGNEYSGKGEYEKACECYEKALKATETTLGKDHPNML